MNNNPVQQWNIDLYEQSTILLLSEQYLKSELKHNIEVSSNYAGDASLDDINLYASCLATSQRCFYENITCSDDIK